MRHRGSAPVRVESCTAAGGRRIAGLISRVAGSVSTAASDGATRKGPPPTARSLSGESPGLTSRLSRVRFPGGLPCVRGVTEAREVVALLVAVQVRADTPPVRSRGQAGLDGHRAFFHSEG